MAHGNSQFVGTVARFCCRRPWWVIGCWALLIAVLNLAVPQLEHTVARHSAPFMPANIESAQHLRDMSDAFGIPSSSAVGSVVLVNEDGLGAADEHAYRDLVAGLRADVDNVAYVLDTYGNPALRDIGLSPDGKAINLTVAATGDVGSTKAHHNTEAIRGIVAQLPKPDGLEVYYTGPSPTLADLFSSMDMSLHLITLVSVLLITLVLLLVYRSIVTALVPLLTVCVALGVSRPIISLLGLTETLSVSNFTIALMTAMVLGATTDYAIFVLAGYHEHRRAGRSIDDALDLAARKVGGILVASALTIAAAATAMAFTELGMFKAAGPPIAIAVTIALAVAMTLPYAMIALLGRRGLVQPRHLDERRWRRRGVAVIRHAGPLAAVCLVLLLACASVLLTFRVNFDENRMQLGATESKSGYQKVEQHWGVNEAAPEYLLVTADHDMRNTDDLAALEQIAASVAKLPEVAYVRWLTRPDGRQLEQTTLGYQAGLIGDRLGDAHRQINSATPDLHRLADGVTQLRDGANTADAQLPRLLAGVREVNDLARGVLDGYRSASESLAMLSGDGVDIPQLLADLQSSVALADAALLAMSDNAVVADAGHTVNATLGPALAAEPAPQCLADPVCSRARASIAELDAISDGAVGRALRQAQLVGAQPQNAIDRARAALPGLRTTAQRLRDLAATMESPDQVQADLAELVSGVQQLSGGMSTLADGLGQAKTGVDQMLGLTGELGSGLQQAADYLSAVREHVSDGPGAGFYLPPIGLSDDAFLAGQRLLFAPDGKTARMVVVWAVNPYGAEALSAVRAVPSTARTAAQGSTLEQAQIVSTGLASLSADMRDQVWRDFAVYAAVAILGVLLVLVVLLRSLLAPLFMVAVVTLSFAAAAGLSVLVWQHLIGIDLDWSVFPVSFMALIAVGADYSMLFAARIREESADGMVRGIIRSFGSTGSVITTAGLVFALTMFALMSGRVLNLVQIGFIIGVGLLIDITVVRTVLVPAAMSLFGNRIWWPAKG